MLSAVLSGQLNRLECLLLRFLFLSLICTTQVQAGVVTADDVVRLVRAQDPTTRAAREAVGLAQADQVEAGLYANPTIEWEREHLPGEGEDAFLLTLPIDLSTSRSTREELASVDVAEANAHAARVASHSVVRALTIFYRLIAQERRTEIQTHAQERLAEAARVVRRRREEGSVSGYDQSRIEIEAELAASILRQTKSEAKQSRVGLARLLGVAVAEVSFTDSLKADSRIVVEAATESKDIGLSSLRLLHAAAERAGYARQSATWSWLPELVLSGGPRLANSGVNREGYKVGVALDIPIFSRGQELRSRAAARERHALAQAESAQREAQIRLAQAVEVLTVARQEVQSFAETTGDRIERLERSAQSGYREGELSIVELLDAQRVRTLLELRQLELALGLKEAEVALCAARGDYE